VGLTLDRGRGARQGIAALAAVALATALLAGCGTSESGGGARATSCTPVASGTELTICAKDNVFDPTHYTAPAGQQVKVTFVNVGKNVHEVEIKDLVKETKLQPGESRTFTITPEKKSYKLYCEIHEDQGMEGEFVGE
jgi:plastocyanin